MPRPPKTPIAPPAGWPAPEIDLSPTADLAEGAADNARIVQKLADSLIPFIPSTMVPAINALSVGKIVYLRVEAEVVKGGVIVRGAGLLR